MAKKTPMEMYAEKRKAALTGMGKRPDLAKAVQSKGAAKKDKKTEKKKKAKKSMTMTEAMGKTGKKKVRNPYRYKSFMTYR